MRSVPWFLGVMVPTSNPMYIRWQVVNGWDFQIIKTASLWVGFICGKRDLGDDGGTRPDYLSTWRLAMNDGTARATAGPPADGWK